MFFKDKEEYEEYLRENKINEIDNNDSNYFKWTTNGEIILKECKKKNSMLDVSKYTNCIGWCMLKDNATMALIKHPFGDIRRDLNMNDYYMTIYNNILLPEIANQLQNDSARYYIATEKEYKTKSYHKQYLVTLDFKHKDEKIIHGEEILEETNRDICELNINELLKALEEYLSKQNCSKSDIKRTKQDFIKQSLFNRFIKQCDEHNHNWGILVNEKSNSARMAPLYDMECSCEINIPNKYYRKTDDGSINSLECFISQFGNQQWFKWYIEEILDNFDIEKALIKSKVETKTEIPNQYQQRYKNFFGLRFHELKQAYEKVYLRKENSEKDKAK